MWEIYIPNGIVVYLGRGSGSCFPNETDCMNVV
jgi:hypothetical protein